MQCRGRFRARACRAGRAAATGGPGGTERPSGESLRLSSPAVRRLDRRAAAFPCCWKVRRAESPGLEIAKRIASTKARWLVTDIRFAVAVASQVQPVLDPLARRPYKGLPPFQPAVRMDPERERSYRAFRSVELVCPAFPRFLREPCREKDPHEHCRARKLRPLAPNASPRSGSP